MPSTDTGDQPIELGGVTKVGSDSAETSGQLALGRDPVQLAVGDHIIAVRDLGASSAQEITRISGQVAVGDNAVQFAVGDHIISVENLGATTAVKELTEAERADLANAVETLRRAVVKEAPDDLCDAALERIEELAEAMASPSEPDVFTFQYVLRWLGRRMPTLKPSLKTFHSTPTVFRRIGPIDLIESSTSAVPGSAPEPSSIVPE